MIVTLDGRRLDESFASDCPLQTLLDQVHAAHLGERLIISVAVNGQRLDDEALNSGLSESIDPDSQLDLESGDRHELVGEALRSLALEFQQATSKNAQLADQLSSGDLSNAVRSIGEFVELWQTCHRAISQCNGVLGEDLTQYEHDGRLVEAWLEDLVGKLTELRGALEAHDMVLLGDLLRYELLPLCQTWHHLLNDLAEQVTDAPKPA